MSLNDVEAVAANLKAATNFAAVFGLLPSGDQKAQRASVRRQFAYLAQVVHPDHVDEGHAVAEAAFEHLRSLFNAAEKAIVAGTYLTPFRPGHRHDNKGIENFFELKSKNHTYRCDSTPYRKGDFSVLYRGQVQPHAIGDNEVLVKISTVPQNNPLLAVEASRLKTFRDKKSMKGIHRFLPELIDSFMVPGPDKRQYRATVMSFSPAMLSVTDIREAFGGKLVAPHAAWIVRRVIAQTCAASMAGIVHGAIVPDHVLVDPIRHEPIHIGWLHGVESGRITMVLDRWHDFYPPEVFEKNTPDHRTDIYMAGKTCIWLFGGDPKTNAMPGIPDKVAGLILRCVERYPARRPQDGLRLLNDLTTVIRDTWGRKYVPLLLPI